MILRVLFFVIIFPVETKFHRHHLSEILRVKCDTLLYRTAYIDNRCYFADFELVTVNEAAGKCSWIFPGSKVATNASDAIFGAMGLDMMKFHTKASSEGVKRTICVFEQRHKCPKGSNSRVIASKCIQRTGISRTFSMADSFCKAMGMELPVIGNDLENRMIRGALVKGDTWILNPYQNGKWIREKNYGRYSVCGLNMTKCSGAMSSVIDASGYWYNKAQGSNVLDFKNLPSEIVCVADAENDFVHRTQVPLPNSARVTPVSLKAPCIKHHAPDRNGECRWTASKDACAQIIDFYGRSWFVPMPKYPRETFTEIRLDIPYVHVADVAVKVIVRRGCMFYGYMHPRNGERWRQEAVSVRHSTYGEHKVPCKLTGELSDLHDGLSRVNCFCDPTEATLNDHLPAPPHRFQCIEHHEYNEATQACEWKFESKFCGQLITDDGRRMLEIPNWPSQRRYDRTDDFFIKITGIIVRQHCWATLYWREHHERLTLPTSGYGRHKVESYYNGKLWSRDDGTHRVVCECIR